MASNKLPILPNTGGMTSTDNLAGTHVVSSSSSSDDITQALLDDIQWQNDRFLNGDDRNAAYKTYTDWLMTLNQRQYDEDWRDNERDYTSASSQLQRYLSAGFTIEQAMAAISGSGESGSSSGLTQGTTTINPDEYNAAKTVLGGVSSIASSIYGGFNVANSLKITSAQVPLMMSQAALNETNADMIKRQLNGFQIGSNIYGKIYGNKVSGAVDFTPAEYSSSESLLKAAFNKGIITQDDLSLLYSNNYGVDSYNHLYKSTWDTAYVKDDPEVLDQKRKAVLNEAMAGQLSYDIKQSTLDNLNMQLKVGLSEYDKNVAQTSLLESQKGLVKAQTHLTNSQNTFQQMENEIKRPEYLAYWRHGEEISQLKYQGMLYYLQYDAALHNVYTGEKLDKLMSLNYDNTIKKAQLEGSLISVDMLSTMALQGKLKGLDSSSLAMFQMYRLNCQDWCRDRWKKHYQETGGSGLKSYSLGYEYDDPFNYPEDDWYRSSSNGEFTPPKK